MAEPSTFKIWDTRVIRWWQIWMLAFSSDVWKDKTHIHRCSSFDVCVLAHWKPPSHHTHRWEKGGKTDVWFLLAELSTKSTDRWTTEHPSVLLLVLQHIVQCAIYNVCNIQCAQCAKSTDRWTIYVAPRHSTGGNQSSELSSSHCRALAFVW